MTRLHAWLAPAPAPPPDGLFKTVVPFTFGHETAISQLTHCCKIMIYSFAVGCLRDVPAVYRQTDTPGSPGVLTRAAPRAGRINVAPVCVYVCVRPLSILGFSFLGRGAGHAEVVKSSWMILTMFLTIPSHMHPLSAASRLQKHYLSAPRLPTLA